MLQGLRRKLRPKETSRCFVRHSKKLRSISKTNMEHRNLKASPIRKGRGHLSGNDIEPARNILKQ